MATYAMQFLCHFLTCFVRNLLQGLCYFSKSDDIFVKVLKNAQFWFGCSFPVMVYYFPNQKLACGLTHTLSQNEHLFEKWYVCIFLLNYPDNIFLKNDIYMHLLLNCPSNLKNNNNISAVLIYITWNCFQL